MTWHPGDRVTMRGFDWRIARATEHVDCVALDLLTIFRSRSCTLLLPFDRARQAPAPRCRTLPFHRWAQHVAGLVVRTVPWGGLQFCPPSIRLLPYQLEPALAVFRHAVSRLLLADDVGLGKTVESGLVVKEVVGRSASARVLIVAPASLREQWIAELEALFGLRAIDADAAWLRGRARELPPDVNPWSLAGLYVASVDFVKRTEALAPLESVRWDLLVVDEAHGAAPSTDRLAALETLGCRASTVILLSATPHSGRPEQFEALCGLGAGSTGSPIVCFRRHAEDAGLTPARVRSRIIVVRTTDAEHRMHRVLERYTTRLWATAEGGGGNPALLATLFRKRALSSPWALALSLNRRLAAMKSTAPEARQALLPLVSDADATDEDDGLNPVAGAGLADAGAETSLAAETLAAAQAAALGESKVRVLLRLLRRIGEPAIVFTEYRDTAAHLADSISAMGQRVLLLHGGLPLDERLRTTADFNRGGVVLVATDAASEGLNLQQACRLVVHFELPWAPARLQQRCGRVNRIGQQRRVHEIALVAADTAEQLVLQPLLRRAARSAAFGAGALLERLNERQVAAYVFGGASIQLPSSVALPRLVTMDLRAEAEAEAERLRTRRWLESAAADTATELVAVARPPGLCRGRRAESLTLLASVAFHEEGGNLIEQLLLPIVVSFEGGRWRRSNSGLRVQARRAIELVGNEVEAVIADIAGRRVSQLQDLQRRVDLAREERSVVFRQALESLAGEPVQPGLFARVERRAVPWAAALLEERGDVPRATPVRWRLGGIEAVLCGSLE